MFPNAHAYSVYNTQRAREEKEKKAKDQQEAKMSMERNRRGGREIVRWGKKKATESHNRQEHGAEITVVQALVEVATKKMESARKNLESTHKEKQDLDWKHKEKWWLNSCSGALSKFTISDSWIPAILM